MPIPEVLKVGVYEYEVLTDQDSWDRLKIDDKADLDEAWGYTDNTESRLYVHPKIRAEQFRRAVLLHEAGHAALFAAGYQYQEGQEKTDDEQLILALSPMMLQVLQDNPHFVDWLMEDVMAKPKPGGSRDKRLKANRPKTGAGSHGGKVGRRRPKK